MLKNLTQNQILLIALSTLLLVLAALSFYLLQDPSAPLPFAPQASSTLVPVLPSPTSTPEPSYTSSPTRQTSYTPFATHATTSPVTVISGTTNPGSTTPGITPGTQVASPSVTTSTSGTPPLSLPTRTPTRQAQATATFINTPLPGTPTFTSTPKPSTPTPTLTTNPAAATLSPTPTETLVSGVYLVIGRIIQNGTPVPNVVVWFKDDLPEPRQTTTDAGGHYSFITLAPGTHFTLTFEQADNHQLTPALEVASMAWIEGTLPTGVDTIQLPDFEISLNVNDMLFQLLTPVDGAAYSAANISLSNQIQFVWSLYGQGGSYHVELGPNGSDVPGLSTGQLALPIYWWDGTLDNHNHITEGAYWWRVAVTSSLGPYIFDLYTQPFDLIFNP